MNEEKAETTHKMFYIILEKLQNQKSTIFKKLYSLHLFHFQKS